MDQSSPFGIFGGTCAGDKSREGCADVLSQNEWNGGVEFYHSGGGKGLEDTGKSSGALQQRGDDGTGQHPQNRIGKSGKQVLEPRLILKGGHRFCHGVHTYEKHTHANEDLANILLVAAFDKHIKDNASNGHHRAKD